MGCRWAPLEFVKPSPGQFPLSITPSVAGRAMALPTAPLEIGRCPHRSDTFARWDRAHLHMFDVGGVEGLLIDRYWDDPPDDSRVDDTVTLSTLTGGQQFVYVFDLGDDWAHLCTLNPERIDPLNTVGITPDRPMPYWGWGAIPDQYGRTWDGDDGDTPPPPDPQLADLPALHPGWGPRHR